MFAHFVIRVQRNSFVSCISQLAIISQGTRYVDPMLVYCWATVYNATLSIDFDVTGQYLRRCINVETWIPSKHGAFIQFCFNVGTPSSMLAQHWKSIEWMPRVCWVQRHQKTKDIDPMVVQCWSSMIYVRSIAKHPLLLSGWHNHVNGCPSGTRLNSWYLPFIYRVACHDHMKWGPSGTCLDAWYLPS